MCLIGLVVFNLLPACPLMLGRGLSFAALLLVFFFCSSSLLYGFSVIIQVFPHRWLFLVVCLWRWGTCAMSIPVPLRTVSRGASATPTASAACGTVSLSVC
ncbi:hypothetical protein NP493_113g03047 [Ridgeia piscesae]|uniref:Uncharacterized protein n=1 Tax=Ridgeia piscesae TaxID=27915 RepID=A0AAD9UH55_RIDPI|nr:hypothetical protein NP493_113g03047 [Ridgeia piscesae]